MRVIFDTNIWISRQPNQLPSNLFMSVVVIQELLAGAIDKSNVKKWEASCRAHEKEGTLLIPTSEDWVEAGNIQRKLQQRRKFQARGQAPKLQPNEAQRITRDVLIARTAKRANAAVVTDNVKDFELIRKYCRVKVISGDEYFS